LGTILTAPEKAQLMIMTVCCLHNFLLRQYSKEYVTENLIDQEGEGGVVIPGKWRSDYASGTYDRPTFSNGFRPSPNAKKIQNDFKVYFNSVGAVDFQYDRL